MIAQESGSLWQMACAILEQIFRSSAFLHPLSQKPHFDLCSICTYRVHIRKQALPTVDSPWTLIYILTFAVWTCQLFMLSFFHFTVFLSSYSLFASILKPISEVQYSTNDHVSPGRLAFSAWRLTRGPHAPTPNQSTSC